MPHDCIMGIAFSAIGVTSCFGGTAAWCASRAVGGCLELGASACARTAHVALVVSTFGGALLGASALARAHGDATAWAASLGVAARVDDALMRLGGGCASVATTSSATTAALRACYGSFLVSRAGAACTGLCVAASATGLRAHVVGYAPCLR